MNALLFGRYGVIDKNRIRSVLFLGLNGLEIDHLLIVSVRHRHSEIPGQLRLDWRFRG